MIRTWKIKGKGGIDHSLNSHEYFISHECLSCGWSFEEDENRNSIDTLNDYKIFWKQRIKNKKWGYQGVHHLFENLKKGDFVWVRSNGVYYVTQIPDNPENLFFFDTSEEALKYDCSAQLRGIIWHEVGKEDSVPGGVSTFTSNRSSFYKIDNQDPTKVLNGEEYTVTSLFSSIVLGNDINFKIDSYKWLFKVIGPSEVEDLVALWLFDKYNYVVVPSTNKKSTQLYEFALMDCSKGKDGLYQSRRRIYIQVKNGKNDLNPIDYLDILSNENDELWLVTTYGRIKKIDSNDYETESIARYQLVSGKRTLIDSYPIDSIIYFVNNKNKQNIIPESISKWLPFFE